MGTYKFRAIQGFRYHAEANFSVLQLYEPRLKVDLPKAVMANESTQLRHMKLLTVVYYFFNLKKQQFHMVQTNNT